jgi:cell division protein FtsW
VWFGMQAALASPDRFGMLLAGGIACWLGIQAIVNVGGVAGVIPVTGLTLPFFSAGGTSLCVSMVAAGLLLNVARRAITSARPERSSKPARSHRAVARG